MADAVAQSKVLLKIVMPSAPTVSFAPYASQTIGLTTWDQDITVGGITYLSGFIVDIPEQTNSADFSRGQGGFALGPEGSLTLADVCAGGRLKPFVDSGEIPLIGAQVFALDATGAIAPVSYSLQEPSEDGANLSFSLKSPAYINSKPLAFSATRSDGVATVGLSVGDAAVQGINTAGRYKGASVPTKAFATWEPLQYPSIGVSGRRGNPSAWGAMEYGDTTHPYDNIGFAPHSRFSFVFPSQTLRDEFIHQYCGATGSQAGGIVAPNSCLLVSDGSNSEIILTSDSTGTSSGTATVLMNGADRVINSASYSTIDLVVNPDGMLASSSASSIQLYFLQQDNPICAGASSVIGFQSKASNSAEHGVTSPSGVVSSKNGVLYFLPTQQSTDGFLSWTELENALKFAIDPVSYVASGKSDSWSGSIEGVKTATSDVVSSGSGGLAFSTAWATSFDNNGHGTIGLVMKLVNLLRSNNFNFAIDSVVVDSLFDFSAQITQNGGSFNSTLATWIDPFSSVAKTSSSQSVSDTRQLAGKTKISGHVFDSLEALSSDTSCNFSVYVSVSVENYTVTVNMIISERIYKIVLYAITKLAFGSNPAVVVPGNFPGTSNPTTTPALAIDQLAAWLGLTVKPTGGITPSSSTWGEYLGPDPTSTDAYTTAGKEVLADLMKEAWIFGAETTGAATAPLIEKVEHPVVSVGSIDDVVTLPQITYDYAGNSSQYTAKILNVDQEFDISKGDGFFWGGWQEKDTCHLSASTTAAVLAMAALDDCLAVVCADGYLRCSYDGGTSWPFAQLVTSTIYRAVIVAGGGIMVAVAGLTTPTSMSASVAVYSLDSGRTWTTLSALVTYKILGGSYDVSTRRLWLCGLDASADAVALYSTDGANWTGIGLSESANGFYDIAAVGSKILLSHLDASGGWTLYASTDLGVTWHVQMYNSTLQPYPAYWGSTFRASWGTTLFTSSDLSTFADSDIPLAATNFATNGSGVVWGFVPADPTNRTIYSRDNGATWKTLPLDYGVRENPSVIWDANAATFRVANGNQVASLGDPSILGIWLQCREAYLRTGTLHSETYDWKGLYDSSEVVRWLLDCKDGIDPSQQQTRLAWMCKQARFVDLEVAFGSVVDQLSCVAGLPVTIPTQRLRDAGLAAGLPAIGLISKSTHRIMDGTSSLEIIMPPV